MKRLNFPVFFLCKLWIRRYGICMTICLFGGVFWDKHIGLLSFFGNDWMNEDRFCII